MALEPLSIPLNGFDVRRVKEDTVLGERYFQFHWMDSETSLTSSATMFSKLFQFHWMDSFKEPARWEKREKEGAFNSIEWIPFSLKIFFKPFSCDTLSIPLNGFDTSLSWATPLSPLSHSFNSIEWIRGWFQGRWWGNPMPSFNSIEWIRH